MVVQGLRRRVNPGEVLEVQTGDGKAQFRVVWVGRMGSRREGEAGLQSLPSEPQIWDLNLRPNTQFAGRFRNGRAELDSQLLSVCRGKLHSFSGNSPRTQRY